ncbi:DNA polymerase I [Caulobacter phage Jess A]|nr:DNA polymerase I [Caulobacter phage Jess A]WCA46429.1 DNA polymerase I [Caulobacter phage RapA]
MSLQRILVPRRAWPSRKPRQLWFDLETFSPVPLQRGVHVYAEQAEIMIAAWAVDDGPVQVEDLVRFDGAGEPYCVRPSSSLLALLEDEDIELVIQNSGFDRTLVRHCWGIALGVSRIHDTMVRAMMHSLPGGLGPLSTIMGLDEEDAKDTDGKRLIDLFCKPRPKNQKLRRATRESHPEDWAKFLAYAGNDITAMRALYKKLPRWNFDTSERQLWELDQKINDRGFKVDMDLVDAAIETIAREKDRLKVEIQTLTKGELEKASKRDELLGYIFAEFGVYLPDLKKDTLERRLEDPEVPDALKQLIRVRLNDTTTSTAKYNAARRSASADGCMRGTTAFCGAIRTGRWGGRLFQPQNLPRPDMDQAAIDAAIEATLAGCLDLVTDQVMRSLSNILRGLIIARPGRKLVAADLEQIESRAAAWLSGEQWKLDAIAQYDTGQGFDGYVWAYARAFGVEPESVLEDKKRGGYQRQVGKVMELAQGYEGGVGAWLAFAMVYRLKLDELAEDAYPRLPRTAREQAEIIWDWRRKNRLSTFGLERRTFVVIEAFKNLWRDAHPATKTYWPELDRAAKDAVLDGKLVECRRLAFDRKGAWLRMILPSGRVLCYPAPKVERDGKKETLTYMGVNQYTRKWQRLGTYGGKLFENATQAVARDVMAANMPAIEEAGFPILLTVHDEVITEPLDTVEFETDKLASLLAKNPVWMPGCPLAAGAFEAQRYRKD